MSLPSDPEPARNPTVRWECGTIGEGTTMTGFVRFTGGLLLAMSTTGLCAAPTEPPMLRFAWPDGASAVVHSTVEGQRRGSSGDLDWNMARDHTMEVTHSDDRVTITRSGMTEWQGKVPPSVNGGAERFVAMIPTIVVSRDGQFLGIEGHEEARARMLRAVGKLDPASKILFDSLTSDAGMTAMASDDWAMTAELWIDTELDPNASYDLSGLTAVPQLGGGEIEIVGELWVVGLTACPAPFEAKACVRMRVENAPDQEQTRQVIESLAARAGAEDARVTAFDQRRTIEILLEQATMLPHELILTRSSTMVFTDARSENGGTESTKTSYVFEWSNDPESPGAAGD